MQSGVGKLPDNVALHESIREWRRWRNDMPRRYPILSETPMVILAGFEYLCNKYGKTDTPLHQSGHEELVAQKKAEIELRNRVS